MSERQIPDQMTAVVLDSYTGVEALRIEERPVPKPAENQVLVKIAAAPINPSDLSFLEGLYAFHEPPPVVPGFEGSGTVVATGSGMMDRDLDGKRVACISRGGRDGTWAEYMVASTSSALPLDDSVSLEQGAMSVVNPLTAIALLTIASKGGHKTVVHTAAASALGQMLNRLGPAEGVQIINVVRRDEQVDLLKGQGATIVLNSSDANFDRQLRDVCRQHKVRLAFDAVAGHMTMRLLEAMPKHSKVTVYGGLSQEPVLANPGHLIFQGKSIDGFWLTTWMAQKDSNQRMRIWRRAQKLMLTDLKSDVRARYPLQEAHKAVTDYQSHMTGGKVLFVTGE
jgi:NADPH:quinone reductase-like Zn-dependent oxidoreductase